MRTQLTGFFLTTLLLTASSYLLAEDTADLTAEQSQALLEWTIIYGSILEDSQIDIQNIRLENCHSVVTPNTPYLSVLTASYSEPDINNSRVEIAIKKVIDAGCDLNERNDSGLTPLHEAIVLNHLPLVELLLSYQADVHVPVVWSRPTIDGFDAVQLSQLMVEKQPDDVSRKTIHTLINAQ